MADLPEVLELPLAGGAEHWYWLGGRPATDFVNTLRERWRRRVETLATPADLGLWLARAGLLDVGPTVPDATLLREARVLREAIDACLTAAVEDRPPVAAALATIDGWLPASAPTLTAAAALIAPRDDPRRALGAVALDAARMIGTPAESSRMRICASSTCSARFYDRSPAARRRWCSMQGCGNQAKARRYRARHHHEQESP